MNGLRAEGEGGPPAALEPEAKEARRPVISGPGPEGVPVAPLPVLGIFRSAHATVYLGEHHVLKVHTPTSTRLARFLQELVAGRYLNRVGFAHSPAGVDGLADPWKLLMRRCPGAPLSGLGEETYARMAGNGGVFVRTMAVCAEALARLHAAGLLHADVKPDNVVLDGSRAAWLIDLGNAIPAPHEPHATFWGPPHLTSPLAFTDPTMILQRELEAECAAGQLRTVGSSVSVASAHGLRAAGTAGASVVMNGLRAEGEGGPPSAASAGAPLPEGRQENAPEPRPAEIPLPPLLRAAHGPRAPFPRSTQNDVYGLGVTFLWLLHRVVLGREGADRLVLDLSEGFVDADPVGFLRARVFGSAACELAVRQGVAAARFAELRRANERRFHGPEVAAPGGAQPLTDAYPAVWDYEGWWARPSGAACVGVADHEPGAPAGLEIDLQMLSLDRAFPEDRCGEHGEAPLTPPPPLVRRLDVCLGALAGRWSPRTLRLVRSVIVRMLQPVALYRPTAAAVGRELAGLEAAAPDAIRSAGVHFPPPQPAPRVPRDLIAHVMFGWRPTSLRPMALALALHRRVPLLRDPHHSGMASEPKAKEAESAGEWVRRRAEGEGSAGRPGTTSSVAHAACAALGCLLGGMAVEELPARLSGAVLEAAHRADAAGVMAALRDVADMERVGSDRASSAWSRRLVRLGAAPEDLRWLAERIASEAKGMASEP